jgi:DNA-binding MarR family transcriptional regulator
MELELVSVGSFSKKLEEANVKAIIDRLVAQLEERKAIEKRKKEEAEKKNRLTFTDERLKKSYAAIDQVVEQIDQLLAI